MVLGSVQVRNMLETSKIICQNSVGSAANHSTVSESTSCSPSGVVTLCCMVLPNGNNYFISILLKISDIKSVFSHLIVEKGSFTLKGQILYGIP